MDRVMPGDIIIDDVSGRVDQEGAGGKYPPCLEPVAGYAGLPAADGPGRQAGRTALRRYRRRGAALTSQEPPKTSWKAVLALVLLFIALGLAHTWPVGSRINQAIPYGYSVVPGYECTPMMPGDHLQFYYWCWLAGDNLLGSVKFSQQSL